MAGWKPATTMALLWGVSTLIDRASSGTTSPRAGCWSLNGALPFVVRASRLHRTLPRRRDAGAPKAPDRWKCGLKFILILGLILATAPSSASSPPTSINLGESVEPVEVVRCHFDEKRLVVRHADKLHVLRAGDELEDIGLRLIEITPDAAILTIRQSTPAGSLRIIRITTTESGALLLREFATDPAALAAGSAAVAPRTPISSTAKAAPPGTASSGG